MPSRGDQIEGLRYRTQDNEARQEAVGLPPAEYVLVTPVRNEREYLRRTIDSVLAQTWKPREWVIVSDGSSDGTDALVLAAAASYPWIRLLPLAPRPTHSFAAVVQNTCRGISHIAFDRYEFLGLLDADVAFGPEYFERLIAHFRADSSLGLAGGVVIDIGLRRDRFPRNRRDVPGAVQFFRRSCFESLDALLPLPEGGWDVLTCAEARMNGFSTRLCTDLVVDHLKPRNVSQGGVLRRQWQLGEREYACGYHPLFELLKGFGRLKDRPLVLGTLARTLGFWWATLSRRPRLVPPPLLKHVRKEQLARLRSLVGR